MMSSRRTYCILSASTNIAGLQSRRLTSSVSQDCISFGALGTTPLSVLPSGNNSWVHLLHLCSWSFSWTSPLHSTPFYQTDDLGRLQPGRELGLRDTFTLVKMLHPRSEDRANQADATPS